MKNVIIVDLDGTLCDLTHRLKYIKGKEKNWKKFYKAIPKDVPKQNVINIIKVLGKAYPIILMTGRSEETREKTIKWLKKNKISTPFLIMRPAKDYRPDHELKDEMYEKQINGKANVIAVFEDKLRVVDMWRNKGLTCFQVEEWEERVWKKMAEHYAWQASEWKKNYYEVFKKCDEQAAEIERFKKVLVNKIKQAKKDER